MKETLEEAIEMFITKYYSGEVYERDIEEAIKFGAKWQAERMNSDRDMIEFANWLRKEDTEENAEKYCNHSDSDMLQVFKDQQIKTLYYE